jgi:serine/threonine-protein kinase
MQYEIWNSLAGVAGMKLIGLDSTASYDAGRPRDYAAIGRTLGVKHLLEGSVWRGGQRVTIEIRLVDVDHSDRVWERKAEGALADEFSLQTKLVRDLISQLQASLSPEEDHRLNQALTNDPVALDLLLQGCMLDKSGKGPSDPIECKLQQISLLNSAVARDPNLVQAYCALAGTHMYLYGIRQSLPSKEQNVDHRGLADIALAQARRLQPDGGEVHFVTAYLVFLSNRDPDQAWVEAELARKALPNDPVTYQLMGLIAYRQGRWREAIQCLEQGCVLDPISWDCRSDLASFYRKLRRYSDHDREMQLVLATWPGNWWYRLYEALGDVDKGDLAPLRKTLAELPPTKYRDGRQPFLCGFTLHLFERDAEAVAETLAKYTVDPIWKYKHLYPRAWYAAQLDRLRGDNAQARKDFAVARVSMEKQVIANPDDGWALSMLALFDAGLGQKDEAIAEGLRAVDLEPYGARPFDEASFIRGNLALVYAWTGGVSQALEVLESITDKPSNYDSPSQPSYGDLLLNPCWDSLRGDPRFKKILEQFQKPVPGS